MLAVAGTIFLLSPIGPIPPPPPLQASASALRGQVEQRFIGHLQSHERILVGVSPSGAPVRVVATQRFDLTATGDYSFVVPAPAEQVRPGPGTESPPGLRDLGIVWQGFVDKHRVLSATVTLRTGEAAAGLPLKISVERRGGSTVVRLTNVTAQRLTAVTGRVTRKALQDVLARLRAAYERSPTGVVAGLWQVEGEPTGNVQVPAVAPLRVRGSISGGGAAPVPVNVLLGGRRPLEQVFTLPGRARPKVTLRVELLSPPAILPTAAELARSPRPLETVQSGLGSVATSWWYRHYLGSPDALGAAEATYLYRTVSRAAPPAAVPAPSGGSNTLAIVLGVVLGVAALGGLAVWWARS